MASKRTGGRSLNFGLAQFRDAQLQFLQSIEKCVPEALVDLRETVLPKFVTAQSETSFRGPMPKHWIYPDIWRWAGRWHLAESQDVPILESWLFSHIKALHTQYPFLETRWLRHDTKIEPFAPESSAIVFVVTTLAMVVKETLSAWTKNPPEDPLCWTIPEFRPFKTNSFEDDEQIVMLAGGSTDQKVTVHPMGTNFGPFWPDL